MFRRILFLTFVPLALLTSSGVAQAEVCSVLTPCPPPQPPPTTPPPPSPQPPEPQPPTPPPAAQPNPEQRLVELMNRERAEAGAPPLAWRDDVASITEEHSGRMAAEGRIWHNDAYFSAETRRRLAAKTVGENVALNKSIDDAHRRLMNSPGHRANILNPRFTEVGVGVVKDADGDHFITQGFVEPDGSRRPAPSGGQKAAAPTATAAPAPRSARPAAGTKSSPTPARTPAPATTEDTVPAAENSTGETEPQVLSRGSDETVTEEVAPTAAPVTVPTSAVTSTAGAGVPPVAAGAAALLLAAAMAALLRSARSRRVTV